MAKLASLAMNDAEQEQGREVQPGKSEHPSGMIVSIDKGTMQKAGLGDSTEGHAIGHEIHGEIHGKVIGAHEHGLQVQITHANLKKHGKSAAATLYGEGGEQGEAGDGEGGY